MSEVIEIVTVAHMHGVTADVTVAKTLNSAGKVAVAQQTGVVLDDVMVTYAGVKKAPYEIADPSAANCYADAQKVVTLALGPEYSLKAAPLPTSGLHIWVPREGWVLIDPEEGVSYAFQLQVASSLGPVDCKSIFYVNDELLSVDILVVVQSA